jgi:hypothetical protein
MKVGLDALGAVGVYIHVIVRCLCQARFGYDLDL